MNAPTNFETYKASLTCTTGGRNAEYHAKIVQSNGLFQVSVQYGSIGSTLQHSMKPTQPVALEKAIKEFEKIIKEKTAKGYVFAGQAPGDQIAAQSDRREHSGIVPQLLNTIAQGASDVYLNDDSFGLMEKMNGKRLIVQFNDRADAGNQVKGINKLGLLCSVPSEIAYQFEMEIPVSSCTIDGELIGQTFYAFDLLEVNGSNFRTLSCLARHNLLKKLIGDSANPDRIVVVEMVTGTQNKTSAYERLKAAKAEGVVFKRLASEYKPGRPNSLGDQLKDKFYETASFFVVKVNDKRSVQLGLFKVGGEVQNMGNVTIPPNSQIPEIGQVVEVRYLYLYSTGGKLIQPTFECIRDDVLPEECTLHQITRIQSSIDLGESQED